MLWQAKVGCAEYYRAIIERIVNAFPLVQLLLSYTGEIFNNLEYYNRRLKGFSLAKEFDIVYKNGGIKIYLTYKFSYYYYRDKTRNDRKLKDSIKYDEKNKIINYR